MPDGFRYRADMTINVSKVTDRVGFFFADALFSQFSWLATSLQKLNAAKLSNEQFHRIIRKKYYESAKIKLFQIANREQKVPASKTKPRSVYSILVV